MKWFASLVLMLISGSLYGQTLSDRVTAARVQPTAEQVLINDLWLAFQDAQAPLQAQIVTLQAQVTTLTGQLATANATIATQAKTITTRNATISTLNKQVATLNSQIASLNATITSLRVQLATWPAACPACPICPAPPICPAACASPAVCVPPPVILPPPPLPAGNAVLTWDVIPSATGYRVYTGTASGIYQPTGVLVTAPPYTTPSLAAGFEYFFVVTAIYPTAESGFSNQVSKVIGTLPPPSPLESPTGTKVFVVGTDKITDSTGAVWTLGPKDPLVEGGLEFVILINGVKEGGTATFLCYSNHQVFAFIFGASVDGRWFANNGLRNWVLSPTAPVGCA